MNRSGQLAPIILLIVALSIVGLALWSFSTYQSDYLGYSESVSTVVSEASFLQEHALAQAEVFAINAVNSCKDCDDLSLKQAYINGAGDLESIYRLPGLGNFYALIRNGNFKFSNLGAGEYLLEFEEPITVIAKSGLQTESSGVNVVERTFNLNETYFIS